MPFRLNKLLLELGLRLAERLLLTGFEGSLLTGFKGRFLGPELTGKGLILRIVEGLITVTVGREVETDAREKELDARDTETAAIAVVGTATSTARIKGVKRYKRRILVLFNECDKQDLIYFQFKYKI
jgi:hypothetical protein